MSLLPKDITQLTDSELDQLIAGIRDRRNKMLTVYNDALALKQAAHADKLSAKAIKELTMFGKKLAKVDALITELENRAIKVVSIRLEIGDIRNDGN